MAFALSFATIICIMQAIVITKAYRPKAKMPNTDHRNLIQLQAGQDYSLKCGMLDDEIELSFLSSSSISWHFKQATSAIACSTLSYCDSTSSSNDNSGSLDDNNNNNNNDNAWNLIDCDTKPCNSVLQLRKVEPEKDSGYYKCVIQPFCKNCTRSTEIQFVMTYNIVVLNSTYTSPQILDGLTNKTATLSSTATFHCRVHSPSWPSIKWLRRLGPSSGTNNRSIKYNNNTYELLESSGERLIGENVYMSKLILTNIAFKDSGFYDCLAFNYYGFQKREVHLSVVYPEKYLTYNRSEGLASFIWLLLIPILFISIPIIIWMCIYARRSKDKSCINEDTGVSMKTVNSTVNPYMIVNVEIV